MTSAPKEKGKRQRVKPDKSGPMTEALTPVLLKAVNVFIVGEYIQYTEDRMY